MKKAIVTILTFSSVVIILDSFNFWEAFIFFVLVGQIPGTNIYITPVDMMSALATAAMMVLLKIVFWPTIKKYVFDKLRAARKKELQKLTTPRY